MKISFPLKQAITTGIISAIFSVVAFSLVNGLNRGLAWGFNPASIRGLVGITMLVILGIGIYVGMQSIKKLNAGALTYGQAVAAGATVAVCTGLLVAFAGFIYCEYINPGYAAYMLAESKKVMIAEGQSGAILAANLAAEEKQWTTASQMMQAIAGQSVCGIIISLIMGIFTRTKSR